MLYQEIIKKYWKDFDPFLHIKKEEIIEEWINFFIIAARAPYTKNHLLIIPKRKIYILKELTHPELIEMHELIDIWANKLHKKHNSVNLLLRDWLIWWKSNKSINHLHFHLIPDCEIGAEELSKSNRKFFEDDEYINITQQIKNNFK